MLQVRGEIIRELHVRRHVYTNLVERGKLSPGEANSRLASMEAALEVLEVIIDAGVQDVNNLSMRLEATTGATIAPVNVALPTPATTSVA